jgi:hypothetical protein
MQISKQILLKLKLNLHIIRVFANLAHPVEQHIRNVQVSCSSHEVGSTFSLIFLKKRTFSYFIHILWIKAKSVILLI